MATKKQPKEKTAADLAYDAQKFLKELSIKLNFLEEETYLKANEDGQIQFESVFIPHFIYCKGSLLNCADNVFVEYLKNHEVKINFKSDIISEMKKALKKDVLGFDISHGFSLNLCKSKEENCPEWNFVIEEKKAPASPLTNEKFIGSAEISEAKIQNMRSIYYIDENLNKLLELPKKSIPKYEFGPIKFNWRYCENEAFMWCRLDYTNSFANISLLFKAIREI